MSARKTLESSQRNNLREEFFYSDIDDEKDWKIEEKIKHRKTRRSNRKHKKILVGRNKPRQDMEKERVERLKIISGKDIKGKHISLYRLVDNGKNFSPSKPIPKREKQRVFSSWNLS